MSARLRSTFSVRTLVRAAVLAAALADPMPGNGTSPDSTRAGEGTVPSLRLEIDPPGALRGCDYAGTLRDAAGQEPFGAGTAVRIRALHPEALVGLHITAQSRTALRIAAAVSAKAADSEVLFVEISDKQRRREAAVLLRTVDATWNPSWRPTAIAPADTMVPDSTSAIVLDARRSRHPAGLGAMHFRWEVDGGSEVIKGGHETSTTLAPGPHRIVLVAEDAFGNVSTDTMRVRVGPRGR